MSKIELKKSGRKTKRIGRGPGSGKGKTSGRGMSGQKSRTGSATKFFEGGQTSIIMRLPKRKGMKKSGDDGVLVLTSEGALKFVKNGTFDEKLAIGSLSENKRSWVKRVKVISKKGFGQDLKYSNEIILTKSLKEKSRA